MAYTETDKHIWREARGGDALTDCIGINNCQKGRRNSVGTLMCMSYTNGKCSSKTGPMPKEKK
jgi:hypothetical protein